MLSHYRKVIGTCLLLSTLCCHAQKFTVSGYVRDAASGENLIMATVFDRVTLSGSTANTYGFYSITLKRDSVHLVFSYTGYQAQSSRFLLTKDTTLNVLLNPTMLDEIVIHAEDDDKVETTQMGSVSLSAQKIKSLPALLGEVDVLKVLQLLPGVQSGSEGSSGIYVRGGGPDQNLILLDGVPVYNVSHLFGFFSVFNADAVNHVELIKGGFPARYGGRLSSVIDINMKEGDMNKIKGEGSIGLISSKLSIEGPIRKGKTSFIVSARRTYIDLIARPFMKRATDDKEVAGYYFYDFNTKINHKINDNNRVYFSWYSGSDKAYGRFKSTSDDPDYHAEYKEEGGLKWGNIISAMRWNYVIHPKLFSNLTATYSRYRFSVFDDSWSKIVENGETTESQYSTEYFSGIRDWALKADFDYLPNPNHYFRFGGNMIDHLFTPGVYLYNSNAKGDTTLGATRTNAREFGTYLEDDFKVSSRLKINAGIHFSGFSVDDVFYHSVQPRLAARFLINNTMSLKASYASMTQYIHLLTNAGLGLPTDLWVPATGRIKPQQSEQVSLGISKAFNPTYELTVEGYYKSMNDIIEYKDGASYANIEEDWQDKIVVGDGRSKGVEVFLEKKLGSLTGWLGYTLSKTDRQFDLINDGKRFPYRYDRRHDISVALTHQWNERMDFSMAWVFGTGNAVSLPTAAYSDGSSYEDNAVEYYSGRNNFRMRNYHRLDVSFSFWKKKKWGERKWTIGVYNVYNRQNPFFLEIARRKGVKSVVQYSLFPIMPSISYSFKF